MKQFRDKRKTRWKKKDPEERALLAQKGGIGRAAKMTPEQHKAHSKMMLDKRYELLREDKRIEAETPSAFK